MILPFLLTMRQKGVDDWERIYFLGHGAIGGIWGARPPTPAMVRGAGNVIQQDEFIGTDSPQLVGRFVQQFKETLDPKGDVFLETCFSGTPKIAGGSSFAGMVAELSGRRTRAWQGVCSFSPGKPPFKDPKKNTTTDDPKFFSPPK